MNQAHRDSSANCIQDVPPDEVKGADVLADFWIYPKDFQTGWPRDPCASGADAYTSNQPAQDPMPEWAAVHFCNKAFGKDEDHDQAPTLADIECDDFLLTNDQGEKRYRITSEMEAIGTTMSHEIMHYNPIGRETGLTDVGHKVFDSSRERHC